MVSTGLLQRVRILLLYAYLDEIGVYVIRIVRRTAGTQHDPRLRHGYDVGVTVFRFGARRQLVRLDRDHRHVGELLVDGRPVFRKARQPREIQRVRYGSLETEIHDRVIY